MNDSEYIEPNLVPENRALVERKEETGGVGLAENVEDRKARVVLLSIAKGNSITQGCYEASISRSMHNHWLKHSEAYRLAYAEAEACAVEVWEAEVKRRAYEGVEEPVYQKGQLVGFIRKYSDLLAIFHLKGARPEKYRDNHVALQINVNLASEVERARRRVIDAEAKVVPTPTPEK